MAITRNHLDAKVAFLNQLLGKGTSKYDASGTTLKGVEGFYFIDCAYDGYALHIMHESTGETDVFRSGHIKMNQLFNMLDTYILGVQRGIEHSKLTNQESKE